MTVKEKKELIREQFYIIQDLTTYRLQAYAKQVKSKNWPEDVQENVSKGINVRAEEIIQSIHKDSKPA